MNNKCLNTSLPTSLPKRMELEEVFASKDARVNLKRAEKARVAIAKLPCQQQQPPRHALGNSDAISLARRILSSYSGGEFYKKEKLTEDSNEDAFITAVNTRAWWIARNLYWSTQVFFMSFASTHFSGGSASFVGCLEQEHSGR